MEKNKWVHIYKNPVKIEDIHMDQDNTKNHIEHYLFFKDIKEISAWRKLHKLKQYLGY